MGTEKFIAFKEDGSAYRLKGRILRFLDNEPVSEADKTNIRSTLSVPASAEGLTPANNLSDLDNAATARTNLSVNSIDEDAEATGTKLVGPALYFRGPGPNDYLEVADDAKLSFTDGTDDLPFSISAWVRFDNVTSNQEVVSKYGTGKEWRLFHSLTNGFTLRLNDGTNFSDLYVGSLISANQYYHIAVTYAGSGPNSANAFTAAMDSGNAELYINGEIVASPTRSNNGSYAGMSDTSETVKIGNSASTYTKGHISNVQIFNRSLTATEVAQLARGTDLGFSSEWGGAFGGAGTIDETVGVSSWTGTGSVTLNNVTETANTTVGARANILKLEATATAGGDTRFYAPTIGVGKRCRVEFDYYIPSTNTTIDTIRLGFTGAISLADFTTQDAWTRASVELVNTGSNNNFLFRLTDAGANNATATDFVGLDNFSITEIGTLADFRAENYDSDTGKIHDLSSNGFVGTSANLPTLTGRAYPVYETGTWTPSVTFGGGSTGITYTSQNGYYTRVGNICFIRGALVLSSKGSDTGAWKIEGLPYVSSSAGTNSSMVSVYMTTVSSLTSVPFGLVDDGGNGISLYDNSSTGATVISSSNADNTSTIRFSGTYQIQ